MINIPITITNSHTIAPYGQLVEWPYGSESTFAANHFQYWKQQALIDIEGDLEVGVLHVKPNRLPFSQMERHDKTPELLIPLNGDFAIPVALDAGHAPDPVTLKALWVKQGQAVLLKPGCWHWMPFPILDELTIIIIFRNNTSANDLIIGDLNDSCSITEPFI